MSSDPQNCTVLAQRGTPDTRPLQLLGPLLTLHEVLGQLCSSSAGSTGSLVGPNPNAAGSNKAKRKCSRQASARSAKSAWSTAGGPADRPITSSTARQAAPAYINPTLWAAALQQESLQGQQQAGPHPRLRGMLALQEYVVQQVQQYEQLAPLVLHEEVQPRYLRPVRKLPADSSLHKMVTHTPAAAAAQQLGTGPSQSLEQLPARQGSSSCPPLPLHQLATLSSRLEAACQQVIADIPQPALVGIPAVSTPSSTLPHTSGRSHLMRKAQHHQMTHRQILRTGEAQPVGRSSSPRTAADQLQQPLLPPGSAITNPSRLQPGPECTSLSSISTYRASALSTLAESRAAATPSSISQQSSHHHHHHQQQEEVHSMRRYSQHTPEFSSTPFQLQHLRLEVLQSHSSSSPRSRCSKGTTSSKTPGRGQVSPETASARIAALKAQLSPDAVNALHAATAAAIAQQLQQYHAHVRAAQRQLLAQQPNAQQPNAQQSNAQQSNAHLELQGAPRGGGEYAAVSAAEATAETTPPTRKLLTEPACAMDLTTQQLVALLARQDVQVQDPAAPGDAPGPQELDSQTSAVNLRVAAASSLSELLDAANEHLRLSAPTSSIKLDIGRIARLQKIGRQWHGDVSARTHRSGTSSSGVDSGRRHEMEADLSVHKTCKSGAAGTDCNSNSERSRSSAQLQTSQADATAAVPSPWVPSAVSGGTSSSSLAAAGAGCQSGSVVVSNAVLDVSSCPIDEPGPQAAVTAALQGVRRRSVCASSHATTTAHASAAADALTASAAPPSSSSTVGVPMTTNDACFSRFNIHPSTTTTTTNTCSENSSSSTTVRLPAPMKLPAPQLRHPTEAELAALPMPCLPELLDLSHEPVKVLHARLERVWEALGIPPEQQLDMVLRHTSRSAAHQFEAALDVWETAAAAVLQREALLEQLLQLQAAIMHNRQQQQTVRAWPTSSSMLDVDISTITVTAQPSADELYGLNLQQVQQLLWAYLAATWQVQVAAEALYEITGQQLLVDSCSYPPATVSDIQLQQILTDCWQLLSLRGTHS